MAASHLGPILAEPVTKSSGNYLIDTLYLYSIDTLYILGEPRSENTYNNLCINALEFITNEAVKEQLLSDNTTNHVQATDDIITRLFADKPVEAANILNRFFSAFARLQTGLFDKQKQTTGRKFDIDEINNWDLHEQRFNTTVLSTEFIPNKVYELIHTTHNFNPFSGIENIHIQLTFDYVLFLFSISMAKNWNANWIDEQAQANLKRRNFMIVSFLSIFTAYFKPILDNLIPTTATGNNLPEEYTRIIRFINKIIYLHNSILDEHTEIDTTTARANELEGTTYEYNMAKYEVESAERNNKDIKQGQGADKSYELLKKYNEKLLNETDEFSNIVIPNIPDNTTGQPDRLLSKELESSNHHKKTEILLPELPSAAAWEPILSKKMGLSGVEINKVLDDINLGMCKSKIELKSSATQFKVSGIPFSNIDYIRNYLYNFTTSEISDVNGNFDLIMYFTSILIYYYSSIIDFRILTAINNHYDPIYFTKVGSFDIHISPETYKKVVMQCEPNSRFHFITGIHAYKKSSGFLKGIKNTVELQAAHRVMLIFDKKPMKDKIYYYEPFGQFYPVYDMYGRLIPDMSERVISVRLKEMFTSLGMNAGGVTLPKVVFPYINTRGPTAAPADIPAETSNYCNTGIFNLSRAAYLGHGNPFNYLLNSIINSNTIHNDKTLDWISGYCGLIIIFMMVMVKINCDTNMSPSSNKTVDDILIWFGEFNANPFNTYDNLMSRFILRGFGKLVENILDGKQPYIQAIKYDLLDTSISRKFKVDSQGKLVNVLGEHLKQNVKPNELIGIFYKLLGLNPSEFAAAEKADIQKKINSVVNFMYDQVPHEEEGELQNESGSDIETEETVNAKLAASKQYYDKIIRQNQGKNKSKQKEPVKISLNLGGIFGSWLSNKFSKKGKVYITGPAANNALVPNPAAPDSKQINPNPQTPRVIYIDTQSPNLAATAAHAIA